MHFLNCIGVSSPINESPGKRFSTCYTRTCFSLADINKRTFIDRFAQSVAYHGPSLISLTKDEQGDGEGSATDFLYPNTAGYLAVNYFRNRLLVSMKHLRN